jgi:hypothetical protein
MALPLERMNWLGNLAPRGIQESCGIIANYSTTRKRSRPTTRPSRRDGTAVRLPEMDALLVAAAPSVRIAAPGLTPLRFPRRLRPQSDR